MIKCVSFKQVESMQYKWRTGSKLGVLYFEHTVVRTGFMQARVRPSSERRSNKVTCVTSVDRLLAMIVPISTRDHEDHSGVCPSVSNLRGCILKKSKTQTIIFF